MTLIEKLEVATEGSRELDAEIGEAFGIEPAHYSEYGYGDPAKDAPREHAPYSTSIDAALALPPAWDWEIDYDSDENGENGLAVCRMGDPMLRIEGEASTPALAVCIARLRALAYEKRGET